MPTIDWLVCFAFLTFFIENNWVVFSVAFSVKQCIAVRRWMAKHQCIECQFSASVISHTWKSCVAALGVAVYFLPDEHFRFACKPQLKNTSILHKQARWPSPGQSCKLIDKQWSCFLIWLLDFWELSFADLRMRAKKACGKRGLHLLLLLHWAESRCCGGIVSMLHGEAGTGSLVHSVIYITCSVLILASCLNLWCRWHEENQL